MKRVITRFALCLICGSLAAAVGCAGGGNGEPGDGGNAAGGGGGGGGGKRPIVAIQESGENAFHAANYDKARAEFTEIIHIDPGNSRARYWQGKTLLAMGKPAEAREQLEVAYAADVENEKIYDALCQALYEDKKHDELFRLLRQRTSERGTVHDYMLLGEYSRKVGDVDGAHEALLTAARLDEGKNVGPQLALADFYSSIKNEVEASRRLRMAYYIDTANNEVNQKLVAFGHRLGPGLGLKPLERP